MKISPYYAIEIMRDIYSSVASKDEELKTHIVDIYSDNHLIYSCSKAGSGDLDEPNILVDYSTFKILFDSKNYMHITFYDELGDVVFGWYIGVEDVQS